MLVQLYASRLVRKTVFYAFMILFLAVLRSELRASRMLTSTLSLSYTLGAPYVWFWDRVLLVAQAGLELVILPQPPSSWDYKCAPPGLDYCM